MFYCEKCSIKKDWPFWDWMFKSRGPCEICGITKICVDVKSSDLPLPKGGKRKVTYGMQKSIRKARKSQTR